LKKKENIGMLINVFKGQFFYQNSTCLDLPKKIEKDQNINKCFIKIYNSKKTFTYQLFKKFLNWQSSIASLATIDY
jgi:hypothetical protein